MNKLFIKLYKLTILLFFISPLIMRSNAQENIRKQNEPMSFNSYHLFIDKFLKLTHIEDSLKRKALVDELWNSLIFHKLVPFCFKDSVAFLYKGNVESVNWNGDFNAWGNSKNVDNIGKRLGKSDIWLLEKEFPSDSRIDYKIVINNKEWILDPANTYQQMSGFGLNSELRMPDWVYPIETIKNVKVHAGKLDSNRLLYSHALGYEVQYSVYTPFGYDSLFDLPVIYVTDGHEYSDDQKGSMVVVLDNLISAKRIKPIIAVFVDPREPSKLNNNRRMSEYILDTNFLKFVCDELVIKIDTNFKTIKLPRERAILGTSLGGLNSTFFGFMRSDVFNKIAIQSPAYGMGPRLYDIIKNSVKLPLQIFLSTGTINDGEFITRKIKNEFEKIGYPLFYREVNEGHSWGNWRALLDDMLVYFWGIK